MIRGKEDRHYLWLPPKDVTELLVDDKVSVMLFHRPTAGLQSSFAQERHYLFSLRLLTACGMTRFCIDYFFYVKALMLNKVQKWTNGRLLKFPLPRQYEESELLRNLLWVNKDNQDISYIIKENLYRKSFSVCGNCEWSWLEPLSRNFQEKSWILPKYMIYRHTGDFFFSAAPLSSYKQWMVTLQYPVKGPKDVEFEYCGVCPPESANN